MKKPRFVENEIYHIYNRGVEKRIIFIDDKDHLRFIHDLFALNDKNTANHTAYHLNKKSAESVEVKPRQMKKEKEPRKLLVEILVFTLMPNHFHLLLRQKVENGIVRFMQKIGTGYTMYFNKKYDRVGCLFQGNFKAALISKETHFLHLPFYIHTNSLDLNCRGLTSADYLKNYRWSSFPDYVGIKNFPSVTSRALLLEFFGGEQGYEKITKEWIENGEENLEKIKEIIMEVEPR